MRRRRYIGGLLAGLVGTSVSGCSRFTSEDDSVVVQEILIASFDDERDRDVTVAVLYNGNEIYDETHTIEAEENGVADTVTIDGLPDEPGEYVIIASLVNEPRISSVDASKYADRDCVNFNVEVFADGRIGMLPRNCESTTR